MEPIKSKFSVQNHWQKRNNRSHFDIRILSPSKLKLWSWAFPKAKFPKPHERVLAIRTSDHKVSYIYFHGRLSNGDKVDLFDKGDCYILKIQDNIKIFKFVGKKINGIFVFIKVHGSKDAWIVIRSKENSNESQIKSKPIRRKY